MQTRPLRRGLTLLVAMTVSVGLLGATAFATSGSARAEPQTRTPAIATEWAAAWNGTSPQALANLFTPDATYTDLAAGASLTGQDQIAGWKSGTDQLIANVHISITEAFRSGDHVAIETVYSGQINGAPHPFSVQATTILEMDGKLIASDRDYYNLATLLTQSGLPLTWTPPGA
jgi:uncharacterized protein (TIGR02246 family)